MKIELVKLIYDDGKRKKISYKHNPLKYCCKELGNNDYICIKGGFSTKNNCVDLKLHIVVEDYEHNYDFHNHCKDYYPISYCPFCGEKIEYEIIKEIDITLLREKLVDKLKEVQEQGESSDSVKKDRILIYTITVIQNTINYLDNNYGASMEYKDTNSILDIFGE